MKNVTITIAGKVSTGKSAIAKLLEQKLKECNIEVELNDIEDPQYYGNPEQVLSYGLGGNLKAKIDVVQTNRNSL